jgi:hypothetical protein
MCSELPILGTASVRSNEEFSQTEFMRKKELIQFKHDLELERMDCDYLTNLSSKNILLDKLSELKGIQSSTSNRVNVFIGKNVLSHLH